MRILLVSGNKSDERLPVFPLGLTYLAGSLQKMGHEIRGFDLPFHGEYKEGLRKTIAEFRPEPIGISLRNLDNQRYSYPISFLPEAMAALLL